MAGYKFLPEPPHPRLAADIMRELERRSGPPSSAPGRTARPGSKLDENVRGSDVFGRAVDLRPGDHHLVELLLMIDAVRRASAARITAVIPYYGYAKQEKKTSGREPISAKLVANLICTAGVDRVLTVDLHSPAIEGFFDIPVDHLRGDAAAGAPLQARRVATGGRGQPGRRGGSAGRGFPGPPRWLAGDHL